VNFIGIAIPLSIPQFYAWRLDSFNEGDLIKLVEDGLPAEKGVSQPDIVNENRFDVEPTTCNLNINVKQNTLFYRSTEDGVIRLALGEIEPGVLGVRLEEERADGAAIDHRSDGNSPNPSQENYLA
jgi:hypothetical protein